MEVVLVSWAGQRVSTPCRQPLVLMDPRHHFVASEGTKGWRDLFLCGIKTHTKLRTKLKELTLIQPDMIKIIITIIISTGNNLKIIWKAHFVGSHWYHDMPVLSTRLNYFSAVSLKSTSILINAHSHAHPGPRPRESSSNKCSLGVCGSQTPVTAVCPYCFWRDQNCAFWDQVLLLLCW